MLEVALFVEGGTSPPPPRGAPALTRIWAEHLCGLAGVDSFATVVPISKKHLVAMDPSNPKMSGSAEPLDQLIARRLTTDGFRAAVVAWDLVPAWNPSESTCRWDETLAFYEMLGASRDLPAEWTGHARARHHELSARPSPNARASAPRLDSGACIALCMEPMFEHMLVQSEGAVRRALGVSGRAPNWPRWRISPTPDTTLLAPAIAAIPRRSRAMSRVRGDFRTKKDEWAEYILRQMLADDSARLLLEGHAVPARLREVMPVASG